MSPPAHADPDYAELRLERILVTLGRLRQRIEERFPGSGLSRVAGEALRLGEGTGAVLERARAPMWPVRLAILATLALLVVALAGMLPRLIALPMDVQGVGELLQTLESAAQDVVFLGLGIFFLVTMETRLKRRRALRELYRLRTIVHIVDMHQLTKDPVVVLSPGSDTASSPARSLTPFELSRYLDYCSELLSLCSKLAALHVQSVNDQVVLEAVSDIEDLASTLSNKIWQKIVMLEPRAPFVGGS